MRKTGILLAVLAALPALGGCGTSSSLVAKDGAKVYGGTRFDAALVAEGLTPDAELTKTAQVERPVQVYEACCGLVDMPFSFVADTALLPITVPLAIQRSETAAPAAGQTSKTGKAVVPAASWSE